MEGETGNEVIVTEKLSKYYSVVRAVDDINLVVPKGRAFGFLGTNGAGKTSTIKMLVGLLRPSNGSIRVMGIDPAKDGPGVRRLVGYVPEQVRMHGWMTANDVLQVASAFYPTWSWDRTNQLMEEFDLPGMKKVREMSMGMRVKLSVIMAMGFNPELLILDEPFAGLDTIVRRDFVEELRGAVVESQCTLFLSSHLIYDVEKIVDWVAIIYRGKLLICDPIEQLKAQTRNVELVCKEGTLRSLQDINWIANPRGDNKKTVVTVIDFDSAKLERLKAISAQIVDVSPPTLEEIFLQYIDRAKQFSL